MALLDGIQGGGLLGLLGGLLGGGQPPQQQQPQGQPAIPMAHVNPIYQVFDALGLNGPIGVGQTMQLQNMQANQAYKALLDSGMSPSQAYVGATNPNVLAEMAKPQALQPGGQLVSALGGNNSNGQGNVIATNNNGMMTPDTIKALATRYRQGDTSVLQNFPRGAIGAMMLGQLQNEIQRQNAEAGDTTQSLATNRGNFQNVGDTIKAFGGSGKQGQQVRSFDVATAHLAVLRDLATQMGNGNFTPTNAIKAEFRRITGSDLPTNVEAAKQIVSAEVAKAVQGSDVSEGDRERLQDPLKTANSFQQLAGVIDKVYMPLMAGQLSGLRQQYLINTGDRPENFDKKLSPATQKLLQQPAQETPSTAPQQGIQEGATATNPRTGQKIVLKGGQWVPLR